MRPLTTLNRKLCALLLVVLVLFGLGSVFSTLWTTRAYLDEVEQRLNRDLAAHLVAEQPLLVAGEVRQEGLKSLFHMLMVINPRIELYLLDSAGRVLAYDAPQGHVLLQRVDLGPIRRFLEGESESVWGDDPRDPGRRKIFSAAAVCTPSEDEESQAVIAGGQPAESCQLEGYLYVVLAGEQYRTTLERLRASLVLRLAAWSAVGSLVVLLVIGAGAVRMLTRRLERLDVKMRSFHEGPSLESTASARSRPTEVGGDEVERLERTFESMSARIERQFSDLQEVDRLRRELVANVSHDLRTPVASLRGYLETLLLKQDTLQPAEHRTYLETALQQSERLGELVAELFELAKLDSGDAALQRETVSLAELAQDVVQKYQLEASRLGVTLTSELETSAPPVSVDLRLMEGVLENLIENAFRHTSPGDRINVRVARSGERVQLEISDSGCGIPEDELPRIFDRFYRGRHESGSRLDGAGLGLAIVRRVVELHDSQIVVSSTVGQGTAFSFELSPWDHPS